MTSRYRWCRLLAGASFLIATAAAGTPQVVGDEACERYEVDMASFASCTDGKVVRPAADATDVPGVAAQEGSRYGLRFAPAAVHRASFLLAAVMPGFDAAAGVRKRPDASPACPSPP